MSSVFFRLCTINIYCFYGKVKPRLLLIWAQNLRIWIVFRNQKVKSKNKTVEKSPSMGLWRSRRRRNVRFWRIFVGRRKKRAFGVVLCVGWQRRRNIPQTTQKPHKPPSNESVCVFCLKLVAGFREARKMAQRFVGWQSKLNFVHEVFTSSKWDVGLSQVPTSAAPEPHWEHLHQAPWKSMILHAQPWGGHLQIMQQASLPTRLSLGQFPLQRTLPTCS